MSRLSRSASIGWLLGLLALCAAVAAIGGLATASGVETWYPTLDKPPWTPPNWAFGPIWTVLYIAMAVAAWDVARRGVREGAGALGLWGGQLALNLAWSPVFFALQTPWVALGVITALWVVLLATTVAFFRRSRLAGALLVPYLLWVTLAWTLNAWVAWFN